MIPIKLKYYPFKRLNISFSATGSLPESWDEVTPRQIVAIGCTANNSISDIDFLSAMTGIHRLIIRRIDQFQRFQLGEQLTFFSSETLHNRFVIPFVTVRHTRYYTPRPKLKSLTLEQFIFIDTWFGIYHNERKPDDLNRFLAALCLYDRQHFSESEIDERAKIMAELKPEVKEALVVNYQLIKSWLSGSYPLVFPLAAPGDASQKFDSTTWIKVFDSLMGDNLTEHDKYAALPVHETFRYLNRKIRENMKRKR